MSPVPTEDTAVTEAPELTRDQRDALAVRYVGLARSLAWPLGELFPAEADDLQGVAALALVEAARAYDPARNVKFGTYARLVIRWALSLHLESLRPQGYRHAHRDTAPAVVSLGEAPEPYTTAADPAAAVAAADHLSARLGQLDGTGRRAAGLILEGHGLAGTARRLGCSKQYVWQLWRRAVHLWRQTERAGR